MKIRLRHDLEFVKRSMKFGDDWVVKDPIAFDHFLFTDPELQLLKLFDGQRSENEIQLAWQEKFKTKSLTIEQVRQFANRLIRDKLVSVDELGYGNKLFEDANAAGRLKLKSLILSPLVIRFRGVNPRFILDGLSWIGWILFHPAFVVAMLCAASLVLFYMLGHFEEVAFRIPTISQLLTAQGILGIVLTISVVKILHELGHAMACERCGGECFEIGVILLAFIPTLYCNVSAAWAFPERWKRLLVSFGGIYVEIMLAAVASIVWLMTEPGLLNAMMFNVVFLCSVNTLLLNGNPLLRYDGYYLLSDLAEQPNLSAVAKETLNYWVLSMFRVPKIRKDISHWILIYAVLSFCYRWFVVVSIICMVYVSLKSVGLRIVGQIVAVYLLGNIILRPFMSKQFFVSRPSNWGRFSVTRSAFPLACMALFLLLFFYLPLPSYVRCNLVVEAMQPTPIYVPANGKLTFVSRQFEQIHAGDKIAEIESREIDQQLRGIENELNRARKLVEQLKFRSNEDPLAAAQVVVIQKNIEANLAELAVLQQERSKLTVTAPRDGVVLPAAIRRDNFQSDDDRLTKWQGRLTDEVNLNCFVQRGEQLMTIHAPSEKTITLFVGEREIDYLKKGQSIQILFAQISGKLFSGKVGEIYEVDINLNKEPATTDIGLEVYQDAAGQMKSLQTPYRVTVVLNKVPEQAYVGSGGRARISIASQTLAAKTLQFIERLASFSL